jgi:hypothetical protein
VNGNLAQDCRPVRPSANTFWPLQPGLAPHRA